MRFLNQKGISLVELVLMLATVIGLTVVVSTLPGAISSINLSRHRSIAKDIANTEMDSLRKSGFTSLADGLVDFSNINLANLPNSSGKYMISDCPSQICLQAELIKQVQITVNWTEGKSNKQFSLTSLIGQGGLGQ